MSRYEIAGRELDADELLAFRVELTMRHWETASSARIGYRATPAERRHARDWESLREQPEAMVGFKRAHELCEWADSHMREIKQVDDAAPAA